MADEFRFRALTSEDWKDITHEALALTAGGRLRLKQGEGDKPGKRDGTYISKPLDSGIDGCRWHRIVLDADIPKNSTITVSFYSSDSEKEEAVKNWSETIVFTAGTRDALVEAPPGKYIGLKIDFHREGAERLLLKQVKIYYPRLSYLRYLPAVYQEESASREFLERFLSIFESALHDSEETISRMPIYLDPMAAPKEFYQWLASWLSLDLYQRLGDKNREFILHAVEFYKQKGTASGIANLVSFLTGQPCYVKEYMNNVFRSYGMEHRGEEETDDEMREHMRRSRRNTEKVEDIKRTKFYRKTSKTVDTRNPDLLANMSEYCDEVHYVMDTSEKGRYHPRVIDLFVFLPQGEGHSVDEGRLLKVVKSFLPVFVRAKINLVELPCDEKYYLSTIIEGRKDHIHGFPEERIKALQGVYIDHVDWDWLYTCSAGHPEGTTNNVDYRTPHSEMDVEIRIDN